MAFHASCHLEPPLTVKKLGSPLFLAFHASCHFEPPSSKHTYTGHRVALSTAGLNPEFFMGKIGQRGGNCGIRVHVQVEEFTSFQEK